MPGAVYHVDSVVYEREVVTAVASRYGRPPFDVSHAGGVFTTQLVERGAGEDRALQAVNRSVLTAFGLVRGVSHTEFIRGDDGQWYFLETAARVGGAHIVELVEAATGMNLWAEWAKVEIAGGQSQYAPPALRRDYAGLVTSLAKQEWPDLAGFADPEVVWRLSKRHHAGLIVASPRRERVAELVGRLRPPARRRLQHLPAAGRYAERLMRRRAPAARGHGVSRMKASTAGPAVLSARLSSRMMRSWLEPLTRTKVDGTPVSCSALVEQPRLALQPAVLAGRRDDEERRIAGVEPRQHRGVVPPAAVQPAAAEALGEVERVEAAAVGVGVAEVVACAAHRRHAADAVRCRRRSAASHAGIGRDPRGQLGAGRVADQEEPIRCAAALGDVRLHPGDGPRDVAELVVPVHRPDQPVADHRRADALRLARKRPMLR